MNPTKNITDFAKSSLKRQIDELIEKENQKKLTREEINLIRKKIKLSKNMYY